MPTFETQTKINGQNYTVRVATPKHVAVAYFWWLTTGLVGGHHFYLNRPTVGWMYAFTAGLLGLGWCADFLNIPDYVRNYNRHLANLT